MGELFNIDFLIEGRPSASDRAEIVRCVLSRARPWAGEPSKAAVNYLAAPAFRELNWSGDPDELPDVIAKDVLLHVFTEGEPRGAFTLEQGPAALRLTVSVPMTKLQPVELDRIEAFIVELFECIPSDSRAAAFAGPELEIRSEASTFEEAVRRTLHDTSLVTFAVVPRDMVPARRMAFLSQDTESGHVTLRHRHAWERMQTIG